MSRTAAYTSLIWCCRLVLVSLLIFLFGAPIPAHVSAAADAASASATQTYARASLNRDAPAARSDASALADQPAAVAYNYNAAPKTSYSYGKCASYHYVKHGQSLSKIAKYYGVSTYALAKANGLHDPNRIYVGQKLCIPPGHSPPSHPKPPHGTHCDYHRVQHGDTLTKIAHWYGTSVQALMHANHLYNPNHLYVGQKLVIPCGYHPPKPKPPHPKPPPCNCPPPHPKPTPHPTPHPKPPPGPQGYWSGSYYDNPTLSGSPVFVRKDGAINFKWGQGSPGAGIPDDRFSASWQRTEYFHQGTYRFFVTVDDGVRLFIDDQIVIDAWIVQAPTSYFGDVYIPAGYHSMRVEYYEDTGNAEINLYWIKL